MAEQIHINHAELRRHAHNLEAVASDIDPVCAPVVAENAARNGFRIGARPGEVAVAIAAGMDDPLLRECGPYDLLIANILAGPLVELAPDFADAVPPRGHLVLAGLLTAQERAVRAAYRTAGFTLARYRATRMAARSTEDCCRSRRTAATACGTYSCVIV